VGSPSDIHCTLIVPVTVNPFLLLVVVLYDKLFSSSLCRNERFHGSPHCGRGGCKRVPFLNLGDQDVLEPSAQHIRHTFPVIC